MKIRRGLKLATRVLVALLVIAGSVWAVRRWRQSSNPVDAPTAAARQGDFLVTVRCRGALAARRSVQMTAPLDVPDLQIVWLAPPGSRVKPGQVVIRFDPSKSQQDLKEKQSALDQAQATLDQAVAQARITADQDKLDLSTAVYNKQKAELEASKQAIVSAMQGQESAIDLKIAEEKVKVQQATNELHRKSDEAKIASARRLRDAAKAEVDLIKYRLTVMDLKSPLDGVINYESNRSQGWMNAQPFKVGDHTVGGTVIAEIPDLSTLEMESKVEEIDRSRIQIGDDVLVRVDSFPEKVVHARLSRISPLTEQSFDEWPVDRTFRAYALLQNPDPNMRPGMNAGADIVQSRIASVVSIPAKALFTRNGKPAVYVKEKEQFNPRQVTVIARNPDEVAVSGIGAGTLVSLTDLAERKP
ncbi:MAG TPA: efflux RND transporter periplasmic adaptor subunit [Bryobacteraceae bacterium]|jgi:multidrug efflux pump subunit AcrA (membrane-fusion protein)|nr:efflux RND transporter periplasmic adaptor subunit [Bryobacteraceae bacterium]